LKYLTCILMVTGCVVFTVEMKHPYSSIFINCEN
jgi:hypothetical protein